MKKLIVFLKTWTLFEKIFLLIFISIAIALNIMWKSDWLSFSVFITGVLCVVLAAKGHISNYVVGIYNTLGYAWIAYTNHLFGELGLYLLFFLPTSIIGFIMWFKHLDNSYVIMRGLSIKKTIHVIIGSLIAIITLGFCLSQIPTQNTPYIDAVTDVLSIVATFLMMWRYKEQWLMYILLNAFTIILWIIRLINGSPEGVMMIVMWSAYFVNAIYGYVNWSRGAKKWKERVL